MKSQIYAIAQQKGGVGKTTTTLNLCAALAEDGNKVLAVDFDPQGALSDGLGVPPEELELTIYNTLCDTDLPLASIVHKLDTCHLLPANIDLSASEIQLLNEPGRDSILKEKLHEVIDDYDYILIDCPPSLGLLTLNALVAAQKIIIPVQTQYFSLRGMDQLLNTVKKVRNRLNPQLTIAGLLPTMYNKKTKHSQECLQNIKENYKDLVFESVIPFTVKLQDSVLASVGITQYQPHSEAAKAYRNLVKEIYGK
ncbi:MAG: ParA family protein [Xenococcus sp. (in: cyanobacteria)]